METGYVCPDWAKALWEPQGATIVSCVGGAFAVVCEVVQSQIYISMDENECLEFLRKARTDKDFAQGIDPEVEIMKKKVPTKLAPRTSVTLGDVFGDLLSSVVS